MSTNTSPFSWPTTFTCSLVRNDFITPNQYNITICMFPTSADKEGFALGFKKLRHFVKDYLDNSIIIEQTNPLLEYLGKIKTNTVQLPSDPHDYFLSIVLFHKLNSIVNEYFAIHQIILDSQLGDRIQYSIDTRVGELDGDNWWNQSTVDTNDVDIFPDWEDVKVASKFEPKVVQGGKNEDRSVR